MDQIATALSAFQGEMPRIDLDETVKVTMKSGGSYNFKYATLSNTVNKVRPVLAKHGLAVSQGLVGDELHTTVMHTSGQVLEYKTHVSLEGTMQEIGSRLSYMRRYMFNLALGIVADDDDDANIAGGNEVKRKEPKPQAEPLTINNPEYQQAFQMINKAQDEQTLKDIWTTFATFQTDKEFIKAINAKKIEVNRKKMEAA